ncbi:MAG: hypothetical protein ACFFG0_10035 [Candidatus Thorarchaeota archaeon]
MSKEKIKFDSNLTKIKLPSFNITRSVDSPGRLYVQIGLGVLLSKGCSYGIKKTRKT